MKMTLFKTKTPNVKVVAFKLDSVAAITDTGNGFTVRAYAPKPGWETVFDGLVFPSMDEAQEAVENAYFDRVISGRWNG